MILVEFKLCGFGFKNRFEFGDPKRGKIKLVELGFVKFYSFEGKSKIVDFMRGYCDNDSFGWHPKVRLARRIAEKRAYARYKAQYEGDIDHYRKKINELSAENVDYRNTIRSFKSVISVLKEEDK